MSPAQNSGAARSPSSTWNDGEQCVCQSQQLGLQVDFIPQRNDMVPLGAGGTKVLELTVHRRKRTERWRVARKTPMMVFVYFCTECKITLTLLSMLVLMHHISRQVTQL